MLEALETYLTNTIKLNTETPVLLAVSGGIDSVVLANLFSKSNYAFGIAHCNFQLRGKTSDEDETFVKELSQKYKVPFYSTKFETEAFAKENKLSIQMAARQLRYKWFEEIRISNNYHYIATAHHKNDVAETLLMNLAKGTGIAGLHGILAKQGKIIRPLLSFSKTDIEDYTTTNKLKWREDVSNTSVKYERNFIRHNILPVLKEINPKLIDTLNVNAEKFRHTESIYKYGLNKLIKGLLVQRGNDLYLPIKKLIKIEGYQNVLFEIIRNYGFEEKQLADILAVFDAQSGKQFLSATHRIIKDRDFLIITDIASDKADTILLDKIKRTIKLNDTQKLWFKKATTKEIIIKDNVNLAYVDFDKLSFPLTIRNWQAGDYFYPLGLKKKKKKLKRFFTDIKLSLPEKERVRVLCSGDKIVCVIGHRTDERFKVTPTTKQVLEIKLQNK